MSTDWHTLLGDSIERAHLSLWHAKTHAPMDCEWGRQLKWQLRGFRAAAVIVERMKPKPDEVRESYIERVSKIVEATSQSVTPEDLDAWRDGTRELLRAL